ncbi:MAG: ParB/RepB/Spo0J family partition protein [Burkholderiales bacterium]|nr:ParB/RepB/Spo0J family partition protein [Burkholderiales bacterium]
MTAKLKGLGRGLDALLGESEPSLAKDRLTDLPTSRLQPGRYQPRTQIDPESIADLAESIRVQGVMQPILVRPVAADRFEIIAGERRWRAASAAGLTTVPVLVREVSDDHALAMALIENIQREDLNPLEEAQGVQRLIAEFGMTHEQAAAAVGRSRSGVSNLLRLLALAKPVQDLVLRKRLDMGHARALLPLPAALQIELAHRIDLERLSVREAEALVRQRLKPRKAGAVVKVDADTRRLEEELADTLGARVELLAGKRNGGRMVIHYGDLDQLDGILARLRRNLL